MGAFRALRTLRALRPLRAVSKWEGMKVGAREMVKVVRVVGGGGGGLKLCSGYNCCCFCSAIALS